MAMVHKQNDEMWCEDAVIDARSFADSRGLDGATSEGERQTFRILTEAAEAGVDAPIQQLSSGRSVSSESKWTNQQLVVFADALGAAIIFSAVAAFGPWLPHHLELAARVDTAFVGICLVVYMLVLRFGRGHRQTFNSLAPSAVDNLRVQFGTAFISALVILGVDALAPSTMRAYLPPAAVVMGFLGCAVILPVLNFLLIRSASGGGTGRVVVLGTGLVASDVAARLKRSPQVDLIGFVDNDPKDGSSVLGRLADLGSICERHNVDRVIVAFSHSHPEETAGVLRALDPRIAIDIVPRFYELTGWESHLQDLHGLPVVTMGGRPSRVGLTWKRTIDVILASVILVMTIPLLAFVALAVRVSSPGPALYKQSRVGRHGETFQILKFRTMRDVPTQNHERILSSRSARWAVDDDRKTPIGAFLRRTAIDELPQLINVIRGEMSLVGPRPLIEEECSSIPEWAECRTQVRPGLTGIWQVCGQHELRPDELYRLDCQYVREWSFWIDLRILALTPGRLLRGGGRSIAAVASWDSEPSSGAIAAS